MSKNIARLALALLSAVAAVSASAAGWNPSAPTGATAQLEAAQDAIAEFKKTDPGLEVFFQKAYGYAVFPTVGTGGFIFSGAYGTGLVYEKGAPIGRVSLTQVSFGLTIGGQAYSELLFFRDKAVLDNFKAGNSEFSAQAYAVMATAGAAAKTSYNNNGVAVFVHIKGGAMAEASVGGQQFKYEAGLGD
jgi:lipid-binding SYLF domain-containing protein